METRWRARLAAALVSAAAASASSGQETLIDEDFDADPSARGWVLQVDAFWIPPLGDDRRCDLLGIPPHGERGERIDDCTVYPGDGYVVAAPAVYANGNLFYGERLHFEDFRLRAVLELRDGTIGRPGDGMCIVVIATSAVPGRGTGGGGMGATGLGDVPTLLFELDNTSCNSGDFNDPNHVGLTWSFRGFPGTEAPCSQGRTADCRNDVFVPLDPVLYPLHNHAPPPAPPNRYEVELLVVRGTAAANLRRLDGPEGEAARPLRVATFTMPGFPAGGFDGYLGFTGSSGQWAQNHIVHSAHLETLPADFYLCPPPEVVRDVRTTRTVEDHCGDYAPGETIEVVLTVLRPPVPADCAPPPRLLIREAPPAGWTVLSASHGGVYPDPEGGGVRWELSGAEVVFGQRLSYTVRVPEAPAFSVEFSGSVTHGLAGLDPAPLTGERRFYLDTPFAECGALRCWNFLGEYLIRTEVCADSILAPALLRRDYLTDGTIGELEFVWFPGARIATAFFDPNLPNAAGRSPSHGLFRNNLGRNPGDVPTVAAWNDPDGEIAIGQVYGLNPGSIMVYAQVYVINARSRAIEGFLRLAGRGALSVLRSSIDMQVLLNREEVFLGCVPQLTRDGGCSADFERVPVRLPPGENSLILKLACPLSFAARFEDASGQPLSGLTVCKRPLAECGALEPFRRFVRGDVDQSGDVNIIDGILPLGFLFLGTAAPPCLDAADSDDNGEISVGDAIRILSWLFTGGGAPPPPSPSEPCYPLEDCGVDPSEDGLDCPHLSPPCRTVSG
jgi:hypothetical protein